MEPKTYPITVNLSEYTLDIEQLDNLTAEYLGELPRPKGRSFGFHNLNIFHVFQHYLS